MIITKPASPLQTTGLVKAGLGKAALKSAIGVALATGVLGAGQAQALVVTVGGQQWNVTTFTGTYSANTSKFATSANGGVMPWWQNQTLADTFATTVGSGLGYPNLFGGAGPFFAYQVATNVSASFIDTLGNPGSLTSTPGTTRTWAQATPFSAPGPLPALGIAAAFGFSRKLRKRIKGHNAVSSTYSL